jgi:hypothetical protein
MYLVEKNVPLLDTIYLVNNYIIPENVVLYTKDQKLIDSFFWFYNKYNKKSKGLTLFKWRYLEKKDADELMIKDLKEIQKNVQLFNAFIIY